VLLLFAFDARVNKSFGGLARVEPRAGIEPATYGFPVLGYKAVALAAEPPGLYSISFELC
jgi:hypothetical protein